ncbi:hypothetical protein KIW84_065519 [Lathyrus oleraceus]|uniref:Uncharacterized protein n=1 Tax=Pisum sativum TaxID=3888 RepID=A0A9D4WEJ7_PEA|nr:hypothetical protein KIW84_065519 [Pisum sativum]
MVVVDLDALPKALTYFLYHTLYINRNGSGLIIMQALDLYYLLNRRVVNIGRIIVADMDEMDQSQTKKSLGYAIIILILCRKAGVPEFTDGRMEHRDRMSMFCFMHDFCAHTGFPGRYLAHQVDTWGVSQCFRDRFSGDPLTPFYDLYQYPGMDTPILLGGPVQHHQ